MSLIALAIQDARPGAKLCKLSDGDGFHLLVQTNSKKQGHFRFRLRYR
jgi:hypothetical protein